MTQGQLGQPHDFDPQRSEGLSNGVPDHEAAQGKAEESLDSVSGPAAERDSAKERSDVKLTEVVRELFEVLFKGEQREGKWDRVVELLKRAGVEIERGSPMTQTLIAQRVTFHPL